MQVEGAMEIAGVSRNQTFSADWLAMYIAAGACSTKVREANGCASDMGANKISSPDVAKGYG